VFGLATSDGLVARALASVPLIWLGNVSYSLYLAHALVLVVVKHATTAAGLGGPSLGVIATRLGVYIVGCLAAAQLLHAWVEKPSRKALRVHWGLGQGG
jgi:peptidoglycan/LPS O-acetylase OafA/YrhL